MLNVRQTIAPNIRGFVQFFYSRRSPYRLNAQSTAAASHKVTLGRLLSVINQHKGKDIRLASALRIFVAQHYRDAAS
jgi:hypothetical protein